MFTFCFILIFLSPWCEARSFHVNSMEEDGSLSQESKVKILEKINLLNKIHAQIRGDSTSPPEVTAESLDKNAPYKPMENPYLFEGDILLSDEQWDILIEDAREELKSLQSPGSMTNVGTGKKRGAMSSTAARWTFPIAYYISSGANVNAILAGVRRWEEETCVRFKRYDKYPGGDALEFFNGNNCLAGVGRGRGNQQISIANNGCTSLHSVTHEIGHALGFWHEQSRSDRDGYVTINEANIVSSSKHNFDKSTSTDEVGYDYGSVMHYVENAFAKNYKQPTIITKDKNYQKTIGNAFGPSFADVKQINIAYCSSICRNNLTCQNGGYANPNNCAECKCPVGLGGRFCETVAPSSRGCSPGELTATNSIKTISASGAFTCNFLIKAPAGKRVFFQLKSSFFVCRSSELVINYKKDFTQAGANFCNDRYPTLTLSESNLLVIIYTGDKNSHFSLDYRIA